jgi:RNA polymerase sigma factor (sigma-70 family)
MSPWTLDGRADAQSDQRLADLAREGDQEAFALIVARYHAPMLAMARRLCSDGRAEDIVQQTFLNALVAFRSGAEVRHLRGWLHQILRHAATRVPAQVDVSLDPEHEAGGATVSDQIERRLAFGQVLSAMAALPDRQRQAMVATTFDGRSRSAIAEAMGLSEGAVRQLTHRARQTLRAAAYSLTPWPLQRWLSRSGSGPGSDQSIDVVSALSSSPVPGAAAKFAAVVVSGALAVGYIGPAVQGRPGAHPSVHGRGHAARTSGTQGTVLAAGEQARLASDVIAPAGSNTLIGADRSRSLAARSEPERDRRGETRFSEGGGTGPGSGSDRRESGSGPDLSSGASDGGSGSTSDGGPGPSPSSGGSSPDGSSDGAPGPSTTSGGSSSSGSSDGGPGPSQTSFTPTTSGSSDGGPGPSTTSGSSTTTASPTTSGSSDGGAGPSATTAGSDGGTPAPSPTITPVDGGSGSGGGRDLSGR